VRTITIENAGFEFTLVQWLVLGNEVPDHRIIVSYGLITPLVSMSCRLLLRRVASRRVLPRERFSRVLGMLSSLEVKVLYPT
jgi:hypothetical protein